MSRVPAFVRACRGEWWIRLILRDRGTQKTRDNAPVIVSSYPIVSYRAVLWDSLKSIYLNSAAVIKQRCEESTAPWRCGSFCCAGSPLWCKRALIGVLSGGSCTGCGVWTI